MKDDDYQAALQREAAWLDEQLEAYVAGKRGLPANRLDGFGDPAPIRHDVPIVADRFDAPGLRFEDHPPAVADQPAQPVPELGMAQPPKPSALQQKMRAFSGVHAVLLIVFMAISAFGIWQAMQANSYKRQADQAAENVQKWSAAQTALDDALCDAGYPGIIAGIQKKIGATAELTNSEKAILAFGEYRTATPNVTKEGFRVDTDPPCVGRDEGPGAARPDNNSADSTADRPAVGAP